MLTGTELQALKAIGDRGGETTIYVVAKVIGWFNEYAWTICRSLGTADYIDLRRNGVCEIITKGRQELDRRKAYAKG